MEGITTNDSRYKNYLERACFVNFTGRTKEGLKGSLFRKDPEMDVPEGLEYLIDNADGAGESLISLTKDLAGEVISKCRYCLLVDFPSVESGLTLEQEQELEIEIQDSDIER